MASPLSGCSTTAQKGNTNSADYAGKIVIASRGDCLFLEKVKSNLQSFTFLVISI